MGATPFLDTPSHSLSAHYWDKQPWRSPTPIPLGWRKKLADLPFRTRQLAIYLNYLRRDGGNQISLGTPPSDAKARSLLQLQGLGLIQFDREHLLIRVMPW